jgi:hypothetical protein
MFFEKQKIFKILCRFSRWPVGGREVAAPTGRPEAIHGTFYDLLVAGRVFKVPPGQA